MTPADWRELDEARKAYKKDIRNWNRLASQMTEHFDELIDAARPKCQRCSGEGTLVRIAPGELYEVALGPGPISREVPCPDCNGTGWAV